MDDLTQILLSDQLGSAAKCLLGVQSKTFATQGYLQTRVLSDAGAEQLASLCDELLAGAARRVHVGDFGKRWMEHELSPQGRLAQLMTSQSVHGWMQQVVGEDLGLEPRIWGNAYRLGEYIPKHRDNLGTVQLLLCLGQPPSDSGGRFQIWDAAGATEIALKPGEGLLFRATQIHHGTTELKATEDVPQPIRITAVARYFGSRR